MGPGGETNNSITVSDTFKTYTVTISGQCKASKSITLKPVIANMSACCNTTILLGNDTVITASGVKKYLWSPTGSLNCDTCPTVIATPSVTTTYTVVGTDSLGCQTERVITIIVEQPCTNFTVPNVFTPTYAGPFGENNIFYIKTEYLSSWSILIFDRWGKEVFKSSNPDQYWDGKTEGGGEAPSGIYYYIINATCQGTTYKKDGFVQLIR